MVFPKPRDIFVGREDILALFRRLIGTHCDKIRVFDITGPGGSGKTRLLQKFAEICDEEGNRNRHLLFDFYDTENRSWDGLLRNVALSMGQASFPGFFEALREYDALKQMDPRKADQLWRVAEEKFIEDSRRFLTGEPKPTVVFLDTYELLAELRSELWRDALRLMPQLTNSVIVVTGRVPLEAPALFRAAIERYEPCELHMFTSEETTAYFRERCSREGMPIVPDDVTDFVNRIFAPSGGRPILVAVATDLEVIQRITIPGGLTQAKFEEFLVDQVRQLMSPDLDQLVIYVAHLYRRFDQQVLERMQKSPERVELIRDVPQALDELGQYAFIKYREKLGRSCLLHDEWRALMVRHYWAERDRDDGGAWRRALSQAVIEWYYDWKIAQMENPLEQQPLQAERFYYCLHADFDAAYADFAKWFDELIRIPQRHRFADILLDEFTIFARDFPTHLSPKVTAEVKYKRANLRVRQYLYQDAIRLCEELLGSLKEEEHNVA